MPRFLLLLMLVSCAVSAQTPPAFEVATVRPTAGPIPGIPPMLGNQRTTADTLTARHTGLIEIIRRAFGAEPELAKGLEWVREERFDLVGKSPTPATDAQLWSMVQPLLEQRFKIKYHREPKEVSGLAMVIAKNGPKLTPSEGGSNNLSMSAGVLSGHNVTLSRLAGLLTTIMRTQIKDETGLTGTYDFRLDPQEYAGSPLPIMVQEALGLKLESRKFTVQVLVIDHIERPDDN